MLLLQLQFGQIQASLGKKEKSWASLGQAPVTFTVSVLEGELPGHSGAFPVDPILFANGSSNINSVVPVMAPVVAVGRT